MKQDRTTKAVTPYNVTKQYAYVTMLPCEAFIALRVTQSTHHFSLGRPHCLDGAVMYPLETILVPPNTVPVSVTPH